MRAEVDAHDLELRSYKDEAGQRFSDDTLQTRRTEEIVLQRRPWEKDRSSGQVSYIDKERELRYFPELKSIYNLYEDDELIENLSPIRIKEIEAEISEDKALSKRQRTDPAFAAKYSEAEELGDTNRMGLLKNLAKTLPKLPKKYEHGAHFARGGTSELNEMKDNPNFLIKRGGGRLSAEAMGLLEIEMAGIPTVYAGQRQNEIVVTRIDGVGSKDIIGRQKQPMVDPNKAIYVTDKTIEDLNWIYERLQQVPMNIGDFQFIIRKSDGAVFLNDPVSVKVGNAPSGKIKAMIEKFRGINERRKKGEYDQPYTASGHFSLM